MKTNSSPASDNKGREWAEIIFGMIYKQLSDKTHAATADLLPCGHEIIDRLHQAADPSVAIPEACRILEHLEYISENTIKSESASGQTISLHLRRLYAESRLLHSLLELRDPELSNTTDRRWERTVTRLDMAIIIAGAPGEGRLDLILEAINIIQAKKIPIIGDTQYLTISPKLELPLVDCGCLASNRIPHMAPPTVSNFQRIASSPFILPGFIKHWPALTSHPWNSLAYLMRVAGRGRVVPVEVGSDYRAENWDQRILPWEVFLQGIGVNLETKCDELGSQNHNTGKEILYLAQHTLLTQFPALRSDIIVPDYVYSSPPPPPTFPSYQPPGNDDQLVINAWLGPKGTVSPAHTDPYFNCYAQVVGCKTVWLASPLFQNEMYPFPNPNAPHTVRTPSTGDIIQNSTPSLCNTSRVDVFTQMTLETTPFPLFEGSVRRNAFCAVLQPGDLLYIPPGWWHAMRSEDVSFSVSMWF